jgi:hypothetical protein
MGASAINTVCFVSTAATAATTSTAVPAAPRGGRTASAATSATIAAAGTSVCPERDCPANTGIASAKAPASAVSTVAPVNPRCSQPTDPTKSRANASESKRPAVKLIPVIDQTSPWSS